MAAVTNEALGIVLPNFDAAYRAGIAAAATCHLPPDLAHVVSSYTIDEERVARQRQYLASRADTGRSLWKDIIIRMADPPFTRITHLCVRTNEKLVMIYNVGEDTFPTAIEVGGEWIKVVALDPHKHNIREDMPPTIGFTLSTRDFMLDACELSNRIDAWGNVWIGATN